MTILDYGVFMVAGVVGALFGTPNSTLANRVAWGIIALWGLLKLTRAI